MAIVHVAVWAADLERMASFYEWLGARRGARYDNASKGFSSYFLTWPDSDVRLEVMHRHDVQPRPDGERVGWAHVAIGFDSAEDVDRLAGECVARGIQVLDGPRRTGDGYYECLVADPEGNRVELTVR